MKYLTFGANLKYRGSRAARRGVLYALIVFRVGKARQTHAIPMNRLGRYQGYWNSYASPSNRTTALIALFQLRAIEFQIHSPFLYLDFSDTFLNLLSLFIFGSLFWTVRRAGSERATVGNKAAYIYAWLADVASPLSALAPTIHIARLLPSATTWVRRC